MNNRARKNFVKGKSCCNCGAKENLEIDHVIPKALGGTLTYRQVLCSTCNTQKGILPIDYKTKTIIIHPFMFGLNIQQLRSMLVNPQKFGSRFFNTMGAKRRKFFKKKHLNKYI